MSFAGFALDDPGKIFAGRGHAMPSMICGALLCMVWAWCLAVALDDSGLVLGVVACSCWILFGVRGRGFVIKDSGTVAAVLSMIQA